MNLAVTVIVVVIIIIPPLVIDQSISAKAEQSTICLSGC